MKPALWNRQRIYRLTWDRCDAILTTLADGVRVRDANYIVGIAKGGLIPSVRLAHLLNISYAGSISIARNADNTPFPSRSSPLLSSIHVDAPEDASLLLVDDIVGSGQTLDVALAALNDAGFRSVITVSIAVNTHAAKYPDHHGIEVDDWLVFPWEHQAGPASTPGLNLPVIDI